MLSHATITQALAPATSESKESPFENRELAQIGQGDFVIATQKRVLSTGFSVCLAGIFLNVDTNAILFAHIDYEFNGGFNQEFKQALRFFNDQPGEKIGVFVRGTRGDSYVVECAKLAARNLSGKALTFLADIAIESGMYHWDIIIDPASRQILTRTRSTGVVTAHNVLPAKDPERLSRFATLPCLEDQFKKHLAFEKTKQAFAGKFSDALFQVDPKAVRALVDSSEAKEIAESLTILTDLKPASNELIYSLVGDGNIYEFINVDTEINRYDIICLLLDRLRQDERSLRVCKHLLNQIATGLCQLEESAQTAKIKAVIASCHQKVTAIAQQQAEKIAVKSLSK